MENLLENGENFSLDCMNNENTNEKILLSSLDTRIFHYVFKYLESIDKAKIIYGDTPEDDGIKILSY